MTLYVGDIGINTAPRSRISSRTRIDNTGQLIRYQSLLGLKNPTGYSVARGRQ